MYMNTTLIIITIIDLIGICLILKWIYDDAKARNMNPWGWILITGLLSPNFIGLILYILFRHKDDETQCTRCTKRMEQQMNYCPWCGESNVNKDKTVPEKPSNTLLIAGIIIMVICLLAFLAIFIRNFY